MNNFLKNNTRIGTTIFFGLVAFLIFYGLDLRTFRLWDESRLAMNAANMLTSGNYLFTNYDHAPDFWNTKPHLLILFQVISMKLFGFTEGSIRLPSAVATFLSSFLIYFWLRKENYASFYACLAILIFLGTRFLSFHGARAGDYEALLIFWELSYCYFIYKYIQSQKSYFLGFGFIALTLAVLTKGIAGILFVPGIIIFAFFKKKIRLFLTSKIFYAGVSFFILVIMSYYLTHEALTPGFLQHVYLNEVVGRYFQTSEGHLKPYWYYLTAFSLENFYFLPIGIIVIGYFIFNRALWRRSLLLQYLLIVSAVFFILISLSKTKLLWYAYPLYPFIGMAIAILSHELINNLPEKWVKKAILLLCFWMIVAYTGSVIAMLASTRESANVTSYIKNNLYHLVPRDYKILLTDIHQYDASLDFQIERYSVLTKHRIIKSTADEMHQNDWLITETQIKQFK